ncbi:histidine phosphatase family protein [Acidihalobacter prosperus]|uniref:Histidine phosphatase family protein n=1 Tax=Acidihalobacter prosperus TaxID=160660 RepID=A0A1A6C1V7_9GAMM|nr:histidine phosphatase family protein [Acidihalobacter prosperus]OBS08551.1 hypothetical protein Thpro_022801 [Acidihalobacter prosperus]
MGELNAPRPDTPATLEIGLLRHGEPVGGRRYRGHGVDDPLSEQGWRQMWAVLEGAGDWSAVVSSPLRRAREFAEAYAGRHNLPLRVEPRLCEIGMGDWEGRRPAEVALSDPAAYTGYYADPIRGMPAGAEPLERFYARVAAALDELSGEGPILVVAHAGVVRVAVARALEGSLAAMMRVKVPYAGLSRITRDARGWCLRSHAGT